MKKHLQLALATLAGILALSFTTKAFAAPETVYQVCIKNKAQDGGGTGYDVGVSYRFCSAEQGCGAWSTYKHMYNTQQTYATYNNSGEWRGSSTIWMEMTYDALHGATKSYSMNALGANRYGVCEASNSYTFKWNYSTNTIDLYQEW